MGTKPKTKGKSGKYFGIFSDDKKLNRLLTNVVDEIVDYAENQIGHLRQIAEIGRALSAESDINRLLEMILDEARSMSNADAGTLYILDRTKKHLSFKIMQNDTMNTRVCGTEADNIALEKVPLYVHEDGKEKPNYKNVSSYVALTGKTINIPDVYEAEGFDFDGPRKYDASTGYRSQSMLVIPLKNHEDKIIGVLQLLNALDPETNQIVAFSYDYQELIESLASQAAVALTNTQLIQDLKEAVETVRKLFDAFIKTIAVAIDKKSKYTGGHIKRVRALTMMIAKKINEQKEGPFKDIFFSKNQLEELELAAWLHDIGKITTPEYIVDKATKLQTIYDRIELVETRYQMIALQMENEFLREKLRILDNNKPSSEINLKEKELQGKLESLFYELDFLKSCNASGEYMIDEHVERIREIASKTYIQNGSPHPYLTDDEVYNLCIRKGTLTKEEVIVIQNHATMTLEMLKQLPFPREMQNVPDYAGGHHERLDGSGYPLGLPKADKTIPLQTRIIAVADVFEALTAKDRPYKKPMKLSEAVRILGFMKKDNHIDEDIYDLFISSGLYMKYAEKELSQDQIDLPGNQ